MIVTWSWSTCHDRLTLQPAFLDTQRDEKAAWWALQQNKETQVPHPPRQSLVTAQERPLAHQRWGTAGFHSPELPLFKVLVFLTPSCCLALPTVRCVDTGLRPTVRLLPHIHTVLHARSGMSDSLRPHGLQPASLPCPRGSPGKNTGVGGHFLLQGVFLTQGLNPCLLCLQQCRRFFTTWAIKTKFSVSLVHITFYSPKELFSWFCTSVLNLV